METIIYTKNLALNPAQKSNIEHKFAKLNRLCRKIANLKLDLSHDAHHKKGQVYRIEANLAFPEKLFRVVDFDFDLMAGIIKVREKLEREIIKYKEKNIDKKRKSW